MAASLDPTVLNPITLCVFFVGILFVVYLVYRHLTLVAARDARITELMQDKRHLQRLVDGYEAILEDRPSKTEDTVFRQVLR